MGPHVRTTVALVLAALPIASFAATRASREHAPRHAALAPQDSVTAMRERAAANVLERIRGRENEPAEAVFRNIEVMKGIPAGRLVRIMDQGFGRSLGVACGHCHVRGDWSSDDKTEKQIARGMWTMTGAINREMLPRIPNLKAENPTVNCGTCHRGEVSPPPNTRPEQQPPRQAPPPGR